MFSLRLKAELVGIALVIGLSYFLYKSRMEVSSQSALAAVKPVVDSSLSKIKDIGKVTDTKKYLTTPGCKQPTLAEETIVREPSSITTSRTSQATPAGAALDQVQPRRIIGVRGSPLQPGKLIGIEAGYNLTKNLDVLVGYNIYGPAQERYSIEAQIRF